MRISEASSDTRKRLALTFLAAFVLYVVVILVAGEALNVASLVLGLVLAALIVWMAEQRRRRGAEDPRA